MRKTSEKILFPQKTCFLIESIITLHHKVLLNFSKVVMNNNEHLESLQQIRSMMERSSRFISLSGLSGVAAGIIALAGAAVAFAYLGIKPFSGPHFYLTEPAYEKWGLNFYEFFALDGGIVLFLALAAGIFFTCLLYTSPSPRDS